MSEKDAGKVEVVEEKGKVEDVQGKEGEVSEGKEEIVDIQEEKVKEKTISAEKLAKEFKEHSVAEFFRKNRQMLGLYGKVRTLTTIVHEYVTNNLDACEEANILPDIDVKIDELGPEYYEVTVQDNGPGLTEKTVGKALGQLLAGTKFHRQIQSRGQQGIGAAGCTMLSQSTTGKPVKVITGTGNGKCVSLELTIDAEKNTPVISNLKKFEKEFRGVAVQAKFKGVLYKESEQAPLEYLRRTAIANPHAQITFRDPKGKKSIFNRSLRHIPKKPIASKPHPKGLTVDELIKLSQMTIARKVNSFLKSDFDRTGATTIKKVQEMVPFDLNKDPKQLSWDEAEAIVDAFKKVDISAPTTEGLSPIGEERIKKSLDNIVEPEIVHTLTRKARVYAGGYAFQIEVGIAYGGGAGRVIGNGGEDVEKRAEVMRFANRAPLLFDAGNCAITKAVNSVEWRRYAISDVSNAPLSIFVNLISVHVPYTGAGKQAIADEEEVMEELRLSLMQVGRKTARYILQKEREKIKQQKKETFMKYAIEVCIAVGEMTKKDPEKLKKKLLDSVVKKLKLEEAEDAKKDEELTDDAKVEEELDKIEEKKEKEAEKEKAKEEKKEEKAQRKGKVTAGKKSAKVEKKKSEKKKGKKAGGKK